MPFGSKAIELYKTKLRYLCNFNPYILIFWSLFLSSRLFYQAYRGTCNNHFAFRKLKKAISLFSFLQNLVLYIYYFFVIFVSLSQYFSYCSIKSRRHSIAKRELIIYIYLDYSN